MKNEPQAKALEPSSGVELANCPMCDCRAFSKLEVFAAPKDGSGNAYWRYRCPKCKTEFLSPPLKTEADARNWWNTRSQPSTPTGGGENENLRLAASAEKFSSYYSYIAELLGLPMDSPLVPVENEIRRLQAAQALNSSSRVRELVEAVEYAIPRIVSYEGNIKSELRAALEAVKGIEPND